MGRSFIIPPLVAALGFVVLIVGYGLGYAPITTIIPGANSMKPVTATLFAVSGLVLPLVYRRRGVLSGSALTWLMIYMVIIGSAGWSGVAHAFGFGEWFPTLNAGPPSIGTMMAFGVVELIGFRALWSRPPEPRLGWLLIAVGASSTLGYILDVPALYFTVGDFDAMAVHTGLCFLALGIAHTGAKAVER